MEQHGESGMADEDESAQGNELPAQPKSGEHDQPFFLELAAKGKDEWNKWRRANKDVRVTFAGVDFSEGTNDQISFEGFEFGDDADFSNCKWRDAKGTGDEGFLRGRAYFINAKFGDGSKFTNATFGSLASFAGAHFGHLTFFSGATFGGLANFCNAFFREGATFDDTSFGALARFDGTTFGMGADFSRAVFRDQASFVAARFSGEAIFNGAAFADRITFQRAYFDRPATFTGAVFGDQTSFAGASFGSAANFDKAHFDGKVAFNFAHFASVSFAMARFDGEADFSNRGFQLADFTGARFYYPPNFDNVIGASQIDFTGAHVRFVPAGKWLHWAENSRIPVRLRAFRKFAEDTKNHDLERDLYIEERKAERGVYLSQRWKELKKEGWRNWPLNTLRLVTHCLWIGIMFLYWALADYGRSFPRPFGLLMATGFFFYWCYGKILAPLAPKTCPLADQYDHAIRMLALGNTVPFVGPLTIDSEIKKFLFCPLNNCPTPIIPPEGYQLAVLSQNLFSIILVFFIGLALRNYFKIK
jgi:Pentapeptide repeats (9 copies)